MQTDSMRLASLLSKEETRDWFFLARNISWADLAIVQQVLDLISFYKKQ